MMEKNLDQDKNEELTSPVTIDAAQADLRRFLDERGWYPSNTEGRYYTTIHMMEELGEVARVITHLESRRAEVQSTRQEQILQLDELALELGDVFCHVLKLAEAYGLQVEQCFLQTMAKNRQKYPLEKFAGMGFDNLPGTGTFKKSNEREFLDEAKE
jgi:NTP pyrophosphatase (non-canonical NTP hydrolase)